MTPEESLRQQIAELDLETRAAERDKELLLQNGHDHMQARYPGQALASRPEDQDHWAWHQESAAAALERHGLNPVPDDPYEKGAQDLDPRDTVTL